MCSFLYSSNNYSDEALRKSNRLLKFRGPDATDIDHNEFGSFVHNRLSITGNVKQPYTSNNVIIMFNGEIYEYVDSELKFIEEKFLRYKSNFSSFLDGEYSIVLLDKQSNTVYASSDIFKTKPIWYSVDNGLHISTYKSALTDLKVANIKPLTPNTTLIYDLKTHTYKFIQNHIFGLNQYKDSYEGWIEAFANAIKKRTNTDKKIFIGLSSGYDSGCIAMQLTKNNIPFKAYSIKNNENLEIIEKRKSLISECEIIDYSLEKKHYTNSLLNSCCELQIDTEYTYLNDKSTSPLMHIGLKAKREGCKIFLSGTGCDEIIGDYFVKDNFEFSSNSCFYGKFPEDLRTIYPWKNFFNGTMRQYLTKDEYVIGSLGIEARYPFLDKKLVQEFLNLKQPLKNASYKAPLREILIKNNFPFIENEKRGFRA